MAWSSSALSALLIIWSEWLGVVLSCDSLDLFRRATEPPPFLQQHAPSAASERLGLCSRWCVDTTGCLLFSWRPGMCAQVGSSGSEQVTTMVYIVKPNITVPGSWRFNLYNIWFMSLAGKTFSKTRIHQKFHKTALQRSRYSNGDIFFGTYWRRHACVQHSPIALRIQCI